MGGDDVANLVGLTIGGLVLSIAVRLFLRQSDTWAGVLEAVKADAALAREEAARLRAKVEQLEAEIVRLRLIKGEQEP